MEAPQAAGSPSSRRTARLPGVRSQRFLCLLLLLLLQCQPRRSQWSFVGLQHIPRQPDVLRQLFGDNLANPGWVDRQMFIAQTLEGILPKARPKTELKAVVLEPPKGKSYCAYLKPASGQWYLGEYYAITYSDEISSEAAKLEIIKDVRVQGVSGYFQTMLSANSRWEIPPSSIDMVMICDGGLVRMQSQANIEAALREAKKALKPGGRFYIIADAEDQKLIRGGEFATGLVGTLFDEVGFELVLARQGSNFDKDIVVGYMRKKGLKLKDEGEQKKPPKPRGPRGFS